MKCHKCKGGGGDWEPILFGGPGGGPYYECEYCDGEGTLSIFMFLWMHIVDAWNAIISALTAHKRMPDEDYRYKIAMGEGKRNK